jgi:hypothetical protein
MSMTIPMFLVDGDIGNVERTELLKQFLNGTGELFIHSFDSGYLLQR